MKDKAKYNKEYYERNKDKIIEQAKIRVRKWEKENKEIKNTRCREYRKKDPEKQREIQKKSRIKLKIETMTRLCDGTPKCSCCGESILEFLTIDHINGGGGKHRSELKRGSGDIYRWLKSNNYPEGFQVLCFNCNSSKHYGNGVCAHKRIS